MINANILLIRDVRKINKTHNHHEVHREIIGILQKYRQTHGKEMLTSIRLATEGQCASGMLKHVLIHLTYKRKYKRTMASVYRYSFFFFFWLKLMEKMEIFCSFFGYIMRKRRQ